MWSDIAAQLKVFVGLIGAVAAALLGIAARSAYSDEKFHWRRFWAEGIFAMFVALIAGGLGEYLTMPPLVVYAFAGAAGYLGPQFLAGWLRRKAGEEESGDAKHP